MADQKLVAQNFDLGMQQDRSRDQLPKGAAWRLVDFIPQNRAPLAKRGGWVWGSMDLNQLGTAGRLNAVAWSPFANRGHLIAVSDAGSIFRVGLGSALDENAGAFVSAGGVVPTSKPFWHKDRIIIPQGLAGAPVDPVKYYDSGGGTFVTASVGGTPPRARFGFSYGDFLALGNGYDPASAYALRENRLWFSNVGAPDSYNTGVGGGFMDFPREVIGGVFNRSLILVFGYEQVYLVQGTLPPPGGDFQQTVLFNIGCFDERAICSYREYVIWANASGIWKTDGTTPTDLTKLAGLSRPWRDVAGDFTQSAGWSASGGIMFGQYYISIQDGLGVNRGTFVIDLDTNVGVMHSNIKTMMFAQRSAAQGNALESGADEMFGAWAEGGRVIRMSSIVEPSDMNQLDADGTPVLPYLESPFYKIGRTEEKRIRSAYIGYDLRDGGYDPTLAVGYALSPELETYVEQAYEFPAGDRFDRQRVDIRQKSEGVSLRIRQTAPSAATRISEIELEGHELEGSR